MKIKTVGHTLSLFLVITLALCLLWALVAPVNLHMHTAWQPLLPGFNWSLPGIIIGLIGAYAYGWYIALVFVPIYNFFNKKS